MVIEHFKKLCLGAILCTGCFTCLSAEPAAQDDLAFRVQVGAHAGPGYYHGQRRWRRHPNYWYWRRHHYRMPRRYRHYRGYPYHYYHGHPHSGIYFYYGG